MNLSGKIVLLTGATGGIGSAIASELGRRGASIIAVARRRSRLDLLCDRLRSRRNDLLPIAADLADPNQRQRLIETVNGLATHLDVVIHCAGIQRFGFFEKESAADADAQFAVNAVAPIALTRAFLPAMIAHGTGRIVMIGAVSGSIGVPCFASYSASKFALRGFSEALRRELSATGVGVTYIAPRFTRTAFNPLEVVRMAYAFKVRQDEPQAVALRVVEAIETARDSCYLGWRERVAIALNAVMPRWMDGTLSRRGLRMRPFALMAPQENTRPS
jgi:short-subunit dehydrogenase